jgi:hypothetical protein
MKSFTMDFSGWLEENGAAIRLRFHQCSVKGNYTELRWSQRASRVATAVLVLLLSNAILEK